jgi:hypothetical protein
VRTTTEKRFAVRAGAGEEPPGIGRMKNAVKNRNIRADPLPTAAGTV